MPYAKKICPTCHNPMDGRSQQCRKCKPSYLRTQEHRLLMSVHTKGKKKKYPSASTRPEIAEKIRQAWTPEKREAARKSRATKSTVPIPEGGGFDPSDLFK